MFASNYIYFLISHHTHPFDIEFSNSAIMHCMIPVAQGQCHKAEQYRLEKEDTELLKEEDSGKGLRLR